VTAHEHNKDKRKVKCWVWVFQSFFSSYKLLLGSVFCWWLHV